MNKGKSQNLDTILIATGDTSLADYYSNILNPEFKVIASSASAEILDQLSRTQPVLLIIDPLYIKKDLDGALSKIINTHPGMRIVMIENDTDRKVDQHSLFKNGVHGFCSQDISKTLLCKAVQLVIAGEYWVPRKLITQVISELAQDADTIVSTPNGPEDSLISTLTPRELQVARMVHLGGNNKMIARELDISERTVKAHLSAIFRKLDIENRLHLALYFSGRS